jgi:hypothetical protein
MILAQKQTWTPVEQNRGPGYESTQLYPLIFDIGTKDIHWRKDCLFNKCWWEKWFSAWKKLKLDPCSSPCTSINLKWIKDLNIRSETLKLVRERAEHTLEVIDIGKDFLNRSPAAQQLRERIDKWEYIKLRSLCTTKEMVSKLKRLLQNGRKHLPAIHQTKYW